MYRSMNDIVRGYTYNKMRAGLYTKGSAASIQPYIFVFRPLFLLLR